MLRARIAVALSAQACEELLQAGIHGRIRCELLRDVGHHFAEAGILSESFPQIPKKHGFNKSFADFTRIAQVDL